MKPADRCPGVLRPHLAADGAMVRIRIPGGQTTGTALRRLVEMATAYGSGLLQLTSRGSVQVRGLPEVLPEAVVEAVAAAGFLPSARHERVRNVVASPLTGRYGGSADLRAMIRSLDAALVGDPLLAELPGRFLFCLDDGRGDVSGLPLDLGYRALGPDRGLVLVGSGAAGLAVETADAVPQILALARRFLASRGAAWHVRDVSTPLVQDLVLAPVTSAKPTRLGAVGPHASVAAPLGLLSPEQVAAVLAVVGDGPLVITPWRGLVLPGAAARLPELTAVGLVTDTASAWAMISACVGAPWCGSGRADTRALARALAAEPTPLPRTHLSGCERRCGAPATPHVDLVAPTLARARAATRDFVHA